jgi:hypothetical protein
MAHVAVVAVKVSDTTAATGTAITAAMVKTKQVAISGVVIPTRCLLTMV